MSKRTQQVHIDVFYGDRPTHESERRAISTIRAELQHRGVSAMLLVNFFLPRGAMQLDLVIVTDQRCVVVELKSLDASLPLTATTNGPWQQTLPNATTRPVGDRNFYIQAKEQTYGLSDVLAALARTGRVPGPLRRTFYRQIDTIVAIGPRVPAGSQVHPFDYVVATGLDTVVDFLLAPGRGLTQWTRAHWNELIRELGLYPEADDDPEVQRRRADSAAVDDYRHRFRQALAGDLHPLIPAVGRIDGQQASIDAELLAASLAPPSSRVLLLGESGNGKTHLARHTAIRLSEIGQLVVWLSADDYTKNDFGVQLSRAVGPYSTEGAWALLRKAADSGVGITVIVDALQASAHRTELLSQLNALLLQIPASVLVTSIDGGDCDALLAPSARVRLDAPAGEERAQLAVSYGTASGVADFAEYRTRFDISVAAQVITELPTGSPRADVLDAYVARLTPSEPVRVGLRCIAAAMDSRVATVMPVNEAMAALRRCPPLVGDPSVVNEVLNSRLVSVRQGRLRFGHERQARFLAAEHLVVSSADGAELGRSLAQPPQQDLCEYALVLERDPARRYDAIRELADDELFAAAAGGAFGADTARAALADMTELLVHARVATQQAVFCGPDDDRFWARGWHCPRPWASIEMALMRAIGRGVLNGLLLDEVGELLDATDEELRPQMVALRQAGHRTAVSTVFASAYAVQYPRDDRTLPAAYICGVIDTSRHWGARGDTESAWATEMWRPNPSWGRLHIAALLSRPLRHPDDAVNALNLMRAGWHAGAYHLRLEVLEIARFAHHVVPDDDRDDIADFLETLDASYNVGLSSFLVEVLGLYERIEPVATLHDVNREIGEVICNPEDPRLQAAAASIVSRQYEDERVFGPYGEAVMGLPQSQQLTLYAMAAMASGDSIGFGYPEAISALADCITATDDRTGRAIAYAARQVRFDAFSRQDGVAGHLHGLRGWAKVADRLPEAVQDVEHQEPAIMYLSGVWRLVDELLFPLLRAEELPTALSGPIWTRLRTLCPGPATVVLSDIRGVLIPGYDSDIKFTPHDLMVEAYPDQLRALMEWALTHREEFREWPVFGLADYVLAALGMVGVPATADMLRHFIHHPELGHAAIMAIREIERRVTTCPDPLEEGDDDSSNGRP